VAGAVIQATMQSAGTSTGSYTDTYTGTANQNWSMTIAGFKPATTSGGTAGREKLRQGFSPV
jgi:hypothetical protein